MDGASNLPSPSFRIRPLATADVRYVAHQHRMNFPDGFFARLGPWFLRAYYRSFLDSPYACAWLVVDDEVPIGYVVGMTSPREHRTHVLRRHRWPLALRGGLALLCRPLLLVEFLRRRARWYWLKLFVTDPSRSTDSSPPAGRVAETDASAPPTVDASTLGGDVGCSAVLSHVVVATGYRGWGLGTTLVDHFVGAAAERGCEQVVLVTDSGGRAAHFYERRAWAPVRERTTVDGRSLTTYARPVRLPTPPSQAGPSPSGHSASPEGQDHSTSSSIQDRDAEAV
jgi:ribosomal protein S18 acetylase RimI-like enzyme